MRSLLDALCATGEAALQSHISSLDASQVSNLKSNLMRLLDIDHEQLDAQVLRILIERARPLLISKEAWSQPITSSDPVRLSIQNYLAVSLGVKSEEIDDLHLDSLEQIANGFKEQRKSVKVNLELLSKAAFRCQCCGLMFRDADLSELDIEVPAKHRLDLARLQPRFDRLHPASRKESKAQPRSDHIWPVSLYGDNSEPNIQILCDACNSGKQNYLSHAHAHPMVGVYLPSNFSGKYVEDAVFYATVRRDGRCRECGALPNEAPMTIRPKGSGGIFVPDNMKTVCYACTA